MSSQLRSPALFLALPALLLLLLLLLSSGVAYAQGPPDDAGPPEEAGPPAHAGAPDDAGPPEDAGEASGRQDAQRRPQEAGRSADAPHGNAYGHDKEPGEPANPPARQRDADNRTGAQGEGEAEEVPGHENAPDGNKGSIKVRTLGDGVASPQPPFHEPWITERVVGCSFEVLFYGMPESTATLTFSIWPPLPDAFTVVTTVNGIALNQQERANPQGNDLVGTAQFPDFAQTHLIGQFEPHRDGQWKLKVVAEMDHREPPGNRKQKVFWIHCPLEAAAAGGQQGVLGDEIGVEAAGVEAEEVAAAGADAEGTERVAASNTHAVMDDELEVMGVTVEREAAATGGEMGRILPAVLAITGLAVLALLSVGLLLTATGAGLRRFGRSSGS